MSHRRSATAPRRRPERARERAGDWRSRVHRSGAGGPAAGGRAPRRGGRRPCPAAIAGGCRRGRRCSRSTSSRRSSTGLHESNEEVAMYLKSTAHRPERAIDPAQMFTTPPPIFSGPQRGRGDDWRRQTATPPKRSDTCLGRRVEFGGVGDTRGGTRAERVDHLVCHSITKTVPERSHGDRLWLSVRVGRQSLGYGFRLQRHDIHHSRTPG